jgi:hypothetical protein
MGGFADQFAVPHEFVPIDTTCTTLATFEACAVRPSLITSSLIDHERSDGHPLEHDGTNPG